MTGWPAAFHGCLQIRQESGRFAFPMRGLAEIGAGGEEIVRGKLGLVAGRATAPHAVAEIEEFTPVFSRPFDLEKDASDAEPEWADIRVIEKIDRAEGVSGFIDEADADEALAIVVIEFARAGMRDGKGARVLLHVSRGVLPAAGCLAHGMPRGVEREPLFIGHRRAHFDSQMRASFPRAALAF